MARRVTGRRSKVVDLEACIATIDSGSSISLGGNVNNNVAMAGVRQLIRAGCSDLELIAFGQGIGADLLIGAGLVAIVHTNYIGLEHLGLAPSLRRAAADDRLRIVDWDSIGMMQALQAGASGAPLAAVPTGIEVTAWPELSPSVYRRIWDPFEQRETFVVPPLRPDVAVLYASHCDPYGNVQHDGFVFWDEILAQAAERVIVVCEELVSNDALRSAPERTSIPGYLVDLVVECPDAAYPCGAPPRYFADSDHLEHYRHVARSQAGLEGYLARVHELDELDYRRIAIKEANR